MTFVLHFSQYKNYKPKHKYKQKYKQNVLTIEEHEICSFFHQKSPFLQKFAQNWTHFDLKCPKNWNLFYFFSPQLKKLRPNLLFFNLHFCSLLFLHFTAIFKKDTLPYEKYLTEQNFSASSDKNIYILPHFGKKT